MADAPFTLVDDAILAALTSWTPLTDIVAATRITMADRALDIRSPLLADIFKSIRVEPAGWQTAGGVFRYSGSDTKQILKYRVIIETAGLNLAACRAIEYQVFRAFAYMFETRNLLTNPAPWTYENKWDLGPSTQEPYPTDDPDRWVTRIDVGVALTAAIADVLSTPAVIPLSAIYLPGTAESVVLVRFSAPLTDAVTAAAGWVLKHGAVLLPATTAEVWKSGYVVLMFTDKIDPTADSDPWTIRYSGADLLDSTGTAVPMFINQALTAI